MYSLDPSNPQFSDQSKLEKEFVRQSSVCHGCRRCFNYCTVFPSLFGLTDAKTPSKLVLDDLSTLSEQCFHCNLCYVNCPYTPPHEFAMDFPHLMEWGLLEHKSKSGISFLERASGNMDLLPTLRKLGPLRLPVLSLSKKLIGIDPESPFPPVAKRGFLRNATKKDPEEPVARVVLFHTCLVENFYPELGQDLIDVYNFLGIQVELKPFRCCGSPMLDVGDAQRLKANAEYNFKLLEESASQGFDIVSPVPTCALMTWKEYPLILGKPSIKVYDSLEYLLKLKREKKVSFDKKMDQKVLYHAPCHLRYLGVGMPGVQLMRSLGADVTQVDQGCSGMDGGWGFKHYDVARQVGSKMMGTFRESSTDGSVIFSTECPFAGLQIQKASGKRPMHPLQFLKKALMQ
ncbi:MAG: heterodisulfide reductase-related iron-sulfur binding cluster [Thermoprotei archaeon]